MKLAALALAAGLTVAAVVAAGQMFDQVAADYERQINGAIEPAYLGQLYPATTEATR